MLDKIKNVVIQKALQHLLDGNKGSNLLTMALIPLLAAKVNWMLALQGLHGQSTAAVLEALRAAGVILVGVTGYYIGKYPKVAQYLGIVEQVEVAAEKAIVDEQAAEASQAKGK